MNLARSTFYLTGINIAVSCVTAAGFFFLALSLPPEQLGSLSILIAIPSVGQSLLSFSYGKAAIYYVGRKILTVETVSINGLAICLLQTALLYLGVVSLESYFEIKFAKFSHHLILLAAISIPIQIFWYYLTEICIAAELLWITLIIKTLSPVFYVSACVLSSLTGLLSAERAFTFYVMGILFSSLAGITALIFVSSNKRLFKLDLHAAKICLKFGGIAQVGELAQYLAIRLDLILIGFWAGLEASGYYSVAARLAETFWLAAHSIQLSLVAKVAQSFREDLYSKRKRLGQAVRYMILASTLGGIAMIGLSFTTFKFFLPQYQPALVLLICLTPGQVALTVFLVLIGNVMGDGLPMLATKLRVLFFVITLICYCGFIPIIGALGAALGTSIGYTSSTLIAAIVSAKLYKLKLSDFLVLTPEDRDLLISSGKSLRRYFAT